MNKINKTVLGVISFVFGIYVFLGTMGYLPEFFIFSLPFSFGLILPLVAIVTGAMSLYKNDSKNNLKFLGVIGIVTGLFSFLIYITLLPFISQG